MRTCGNLLPDALPSDRLLHPLSNDGEHSKAAILKLLEPKLLELSSGLILGDLLGWILKKR
jgi:hypothetical protein